MSNLSVNPNSDSVNPRDGWQVLADSTADQRPSVGKFVTVDSGKYAQQSGEVFWHGVDKYASTYYKTDAQLMLQEMMGRSGYRVGIKLDNGNKIFVKADNVTVKAVR